MYRKYRIFLKGIAANSIGRVGAALTTSSFIIFIFVELLRIMGAVTNAYIGLITYLLFPVLFVIGLIMIPIGWRKYVREKDVETDELLTDSFEQENVEGGVFGSKLVQTILWLTLLNIVFLALISIRMLHFMDQPTFCGTACHKVMNPEWVTYQQSPHARVKCVECHVGEGAGALIDSKINGMWQIISLTFSLYEKPIPTPVKNLRPAKETCEKCHWPEKFSGNRLKTIIHYGMDETNTPKYTTLNIKIGSGEPGYETGSHWHVSKGNKIVYQPANEKRNEIKWVELHSADGSYKRFVNHAEVEEDFYKEEKEREFDCIDCHNRATHIYETPENAIDEKIRRGEIDSRIPFIKREALAAITKDYADKESGLDYIHIRLENFYLDNYPNSYSTQQSLYDGAFKAVEEIYKRNIYPGMGIEWNSYPSNIGHRNSQGCFRCHNRYMTDEAGEAISSDCTLCHSILANEDDEPFKYLISTENDSLNIIMKDYLGGEFLEEY